MVGTSTEYGMVGTSTEYGIVGTSTESDVTWGDHDDDVVLQKLLKSAERKMWAKGNVSKMIEESVPHYTVNPRGGKVPEKLPAATPHPAAVTAGISSRPWVIRRFKGSRPLSLERCSIE